MPFIMKTRIFKYIDNFTSENGIFAVKKILIYNGEAVSNEYPQSMFASKNKKNNVYPCNPQFYYIKVGFKRVQII